MDGYQILEVLAASPETAGIPVIAVSANAMQRDIERAKPPGFAITWKNPYTSAVF